MAKDIHALKRLLGAAISLDHTLSNLYVQANMNKSALLRLSIFSGHESENGMTHTAAKAIDQQLNQTYGRINKLSPPSDTPSTSFRRK